MWILTCLKIYLVKRQSCMLCCGKLLCRDESVFGVPGSQVQTMRKPHDVNIESVGSLQGHVNWSPTGGLLLTLHLALNEVLTFLIYIMDNPIIGCSEYVLHSGIKLIIVNFRPLWLICLCHERGHFSLGYFLKFFYDIHLVFLILFF